MSAVHERDATGLYSPEPLTTRTSKRCGPSVMPSSAYGDEQAANGAPSSEHSEPTTPSPDAHDQVKLGRSSRAPGVQHNDGARGGVAAARGAAGSLALLPPPCTRASDQLLSPAGPRPEIVTSCGPTASPFSTSGLE